MNPASDLDLNHSSKTSGECDLGIDASSGPQLALVKTYFKRIHLKFDKRMNFLSRFCRKGYSHICRTLEIFNDVFYCR